MNELETLNGNIRRNQRIFAAMESGVLREPELLRRCERAYEAATYASTHTTDVYSSEILEAPFLELAQRYSVELPAAYEPGTVLHVLTEAYVTGGHTRCAERWMAQCPEHKHSCVLLAQKAPIPERLRRQVESSGGTLTCYDKDASMLQRALDLRRCASTYEYVVLYVHMNDPMAIIAFGTPSFKRPVVFFDHADHGFWLGVSVADCVVEWHSGAIACTHEKRGATNTAYLPIPQDDTPALELDYAESRRRLGIPESTKVIFASGLASKFDPLGYPSYEDIVTDLVTQDPQIVFYIAGPKAASGGFWARLRKKFPQNLHLLGYLNHATEYPHYLACADVVADSYPVGGGTALCDAVKAGKPVVSLSRELQSDFILNSKACSSSYEDFLAKIHRILADAEYATSVQQDVLNRFRADTEHSVWHQRCLDILAALPAEHRVQTFQRQALGYEPTSLAQKTYAWTARQKRFAALRKFCHKLFTLKMKPREKRLVLLGITLWNKRTHVCTAAEAASAH